MTTTHTTFIAPPDTSQPTASPRATAPANATSGWSIASLVIGLVSVVAGWTFFAPIAGLVLGIIGMQRDATRGIAIAGVAINGAILAFGFIFGLVALAGVAIFAPFALLFS